MSKLTSAEVRKLLEKHAFLTGITSSELDKLAQITTVESYLENTYLCRTGQPAQQCFLLVEGSVSLEVYDPSRGSLSLETLTPGRALGWSWLIPPHRWCFDGRALEPTKALAIDGAALRRAMDEDHELGYHLLQRFTHVFAERLQAARLQLLDLYGQS